MNKNDIINKFVNSGCNILHQEKGYTVIDTTPVREVFLTLNGTAGLTIFIGSTVEVFDGEVIFDKTKINDINNITYIEVIGF